MYFEVAMEINPDFQDLLQLFKEEGVEYLVVGAYAVMYYTEPRFTKDLDLWINPTLNNAESVLRALSRFGAPLEDVSIDDFCNEEMIFQIGIAPNRIDVIMGVSHLAFSTAWHNRLAVRYGDCDINMIALDNLITSKENTGRSQDELDVQRLKHARQLNKEKDEY